jgi:predicted RNA polymerase sigma factor
VDARRTVDRAARDSYGRLIAFFAARSRDVAASEDALAEAFRKALETWPVSGVPDNPEAWLLTAARRRLSDEFRHFRVRTGAQSTLLAIAEEAQHLANSDIFPDERLKLLFICAHPAIDAAARTPLMLQTVLGLDAVRIASAFLVKPATMGQRLSRAKAKIRDAGISFELPEKVELVARLHSVLETIYAAYGSGWDDIGGSDPRRKGLASEALDLTRLLAGLFSTPEVQGLLALMLYCESRREVRRNSAGGYIPLLEQDTGKWSRAMISEANQILAKAEQAGEIGPFQLEAAIQCIHAQRATTGKTNWTAIAAMYEGLVRIAPTIGAMVGRSAAFGEAYCPEAGLALLEEIPRDLVTSYQPYWAVSAHLLRRMERRAEALAAYRRAIGLCEEAGMREFLSRQVAQLLDKNTGAALYTDPGLAN